MKNIQNLTIDINKKPFQTITANVGEVASRFVRISIVDKSMPMDLTGVTVSIYAEKPDGKKVFNNVTIEDKKNGIILAELTSQVLAIEGLVKLTLLLIKNNAKLCSKQFLLNVDKSIVDDEAIESTNEFGLLTESLSKVEDWNGYFEENSGKIEEKYTERLNNNEEKISGLIEQSITKYNNQGSRTPEDYGCVGDGSTDDSINFLNAMLDCGRNGFVLVLKNKYKIAQNIVYNGFYPLMIIGTKPNYNTLTRETLPVKNEQVNVIFTDNATLEINKMGSVTFFGVSFASTGRADGSGILLKSFHNKFINCSFSQMNRAIWVTDGATNWTGENQILYCGFYKCEYCYYSEPGASSDSEFIGNLIHGSCGCGFYGSCPGYTISQNHFYGDKPNVFTYFNTKITDNYIQELPSMDAPSIILDGTFGCIVNDNNFELVSNVDRPNITGLIGINLVSGRGNITLDGNAVHGKDINTVRNLSFIKLIYTNTKYDMLITFGVNNLRCCQSIFNEYYPTYNIKGNINCDGALDINALGGSIESQKSSIVNGVCHFYVKMSSVPSYANILKVQCYHGIPFMYTLKQTLNDGSVIIKHEISNGSIIHQSNYAQVSSVEVVGSYVVAHSGEPIWFLN